MPYRSATPEYLDIWEWDVIVFPDRTVRIVGTSSECAIHQEDSILHGRCDCPRTRMSSPVFCNGTEVRIDEWSQAGRPLLTVRDGSLVKVLSGKTYRLWGPRVPSRELLSIWVHYARLEPPPTRWEKFLSWWMQARGTHQT